ncbi:putative mitochondrial import inner membrane translocase subunit tim23 [Dioszegia hungarica]|uniref:Mitochondrial import inner membrane translocase subunit tim23 n=1 Tax=Dioszegia hungarica TaxID=4972 RepID=A0AA38LS89_9TREE|nr:putative mitochondrial import inner membrane translocase subunit tim23 [Dioszegia hungarica]KAI9635547.1 putative mitochondrial import inner membrane translocase subunit tim23 [Dioszegia hungarica]
MSFFSGLFSSTPAPAQNEPSVSQELFNSAKFDSPVQPSPAGPSSGSLPTANTPSAPTALDTFSSAYDPAKLHPLAGLGDKLDFLQLDEDKLSEVQGAASVLPSRGWTDDLCVGTGTTYLSGLAVGGAWGLKEGLGRQLGPSPSMKLRINAILNGCTRRGSFVGNSLGVLAIFYNLVNSGLDSYRGRHDVLNAMGAGAISGALFKSTSGIRPAMVGASLMTAAAGGWSYFKTVV